LKLPTDIYLPARQCAACTGRLLKFRQAVVTCIAAFLISYGIAPQYATAQIGVGFIHNGYYNGSIDSNKGAAATYRCPGGAVS